MDEQLDYYTVKSEGDSGFWIGQPVKTGKTVARSEWLRLVDEDPDHFELVTLTAKELTNYSMAPEDVIEMAIFVTRSDEHLQ